MNKYGPGYRRTRREHEEMQSIAARVVLLAIVILTITIAACTSVEKVEPVENVEIDESNNGEQIELALSEILAVRLESNPSTGYVWEIDELDEHVLQQITEMPFDQLPCRTS
jgi:hypothetical protein